MKYVLLLYEDDAERVAKTEEEVSTCLAYAEAMKKAGILVGGERLRPAWSATTVHVADGKTRVLDGPYAEAKEQLGGFHVIDVPDLDAALAWAGRCPSARRGRVEVRPTWHAPRSGRAAHRDRAPKVLGEQRDPRSPEWKA